MRKILLFVISLFLLNTLTAQVLTVPDNKDSIYYLSQNDTIYNKVDKKAAFPGENEGWRKYISKNLKIDTPVKNSAPAGSYKVGVRFIVSKEGIISNIEPETQQGFGMENEVIRIVKNGSKWIPAQINGRSVNSLYHQTVTFVVSEK